VQLVTSGPQTEIGCEVENLVVFLGSSTWPAVDGDSLIFYGADGGVVGEAVRRRAGSQPGPAGPNPHLAVRDAAAGRDGVVCALTAAGAA